MKPLDSTLLAAVRYGLFAVFILPFVVWLGHLYPWVTGKIISFQILVELLFPLYILLAFRRKEFRPTQNPFLYALLAYFAVATLSMMLGSNQHRSFWSKPDRLTGLFFQYHLIAFFLMAGSVWRNVMSRPIIASVVSAILLSLYALLQVSFPKPGTDGRGSASLGNPDYLGQYLVPQIFLCAWLIWRDRARALRWLWILSGAVIMLGILSTKSKGALLGVFVGCLAAATIALVRGDKGIRKKAGIGLGLLALSVVLFLIGNQVQPFKGILYEQRLSIQYFQETSGSRKLLLQNALKGIKQRPLLGWGPENFEDGFYFNYDPRTLMFSEYESRQDRPHNLIIELFHNLGLIGLLAYAAVFYFAVRKTLPKGREDWMAGAALLIAAFSQVGTNLFIFETPMSYMVLFTMFSLLAADAASRQAKEEGPDESSSAAVPLAVLAAAVSLWALFGVNLGTANAASITSKMIIALGQQETTPESWKAMLEDLRAQKTPYYERDIRALASHLSQQRGEYLEGGYKPLLIDLAEDEYRRFYDRDDFVQALVMSSAYLSFTPRTPEQQAALEDSAERASALSPNRHEVEVILAQVAWEKGQLDEAEKHVKRIDELDPSNPYGTAWWMRWQLEYRDPGEAARVFATRPEVRADSVSWNQVELGTLHLLNLKRWKDLQTLFKASVAAKTRNVQWDLTGAIAEWALGDKKTSDTIINEARVLYPERIDLVNSIAAQRDQIVASGQ